MTACAIYFPLYFYQNTVAIYADFLIYAIFESAISVELERYGQCVETGI